MFEWIAEGGLVLATNVVDCKPFRHMLEFVLDWHLIYRDRKQAAVMLPHSDSAASARDCRLVTLRRFVFI